MKAGRLVTGVALLAAILGQNIGAADRQDQGALDSAIAPQADAVLRALSDRFEQVKTAVYHVEDTIDEVQADGSKLQFSHIRKFTVVSPDKLKVETKGDAMARVLWKDGTTFTVLDRTANVYAQIPDSGTIDQMIGLLQEKYGMSLPGADLLPGNLYESMTDGCEAVDYVGIGYVGEEQCHHLAFYRDIIDWQMWISMGDEPMLRKMVITYKQLPGEPQYTMRVLKREDAGTIDNAVFTAVIPEGAERIEIQPVAEVDPMTEEEGE